MEAQLVKYLNFDQFYVINDRIYVNPKILWISNQVQCELQRINRTTTKICYYFEFNINGDVYKIEKSTLLNKYIIISFIAKVKNDNYVCFNDPLYLNDINKLITKTDTRELYNQVCKYRKEMMDKFLIFKNKKSNKKHFFRKRKQSSK